MFLHVCSLLSMGPWPFRAARPAGRTAGLMRAHHDGAPRGAKLLVGLSEAGTPANGTWSGGWGPVALQSPVSRVGQGEDCEGKQDRFSPLLCHRRPVPSCETGPDGRHGSHVHSSAHRALRPFAPNERGTGHLSPPSSGRVSAVSDGHTDYSWEENKRFLCIANNALRRRPSFKRPQDRNF